jgi:5-bromo-4-chloroindolyl phosphate hydrolysis protein
MKTEREIIAELKSMSKESKIQLLTQITAGLLASGHFTYENNLSLDVEQEPHVIREANHLLYKILESPYTR